MSFQVPVQDTNANVRMSMDLQLQMQKEQLFFTRSQQISHHLYIKEEKPLSRWSRLPLSGVTVELQNRKLWEQFHAETTEMIITKSGRRMFPPIQLTVNGLNKQDYYYVAMEFRLASNNRHKYNANSGGNDENGNKSNRNWSSAGAADPQQPFDRRVYLHPDGPSTGEHWMQNSINFSKLKLTNNIVDYRSNMVLTSMHKYIPTIWIIRCARSNSYYDLFSHPASVFAFKETEFIAVTAYQNENITKLKIDNNPFAKGFRETGQSRCKRKYQQMNDNNQPDDDDNFLSDSSDSNRSLTSDLGQKSEGKSGIKNSDDCEDFELLVSNAENRRSSLRTENDSESEVPSAFHRPWLDSPSRKSVVPPTMMPMMPLIPSCSAFHDPSWSYYIPLHLPLTQDLRYYHQYHNSMFHYRKL